MDKFFILYVFLTLLFLLVLYKTTKRSKSKSSPTNLPPGPWKLPLIGNLHQFFGSTPPHHVLRNLATKFGPLMHIKLGEVSHIIVSSPEMAKEIMKTHDIIFSNRPNILVSKLAYNGKDIAFSPYGSYWRQLRKMCTEELLASKRVQCFRSIREEEVSALIETISSSEGLVVNLSEKIYSLTYGITARAALGEKCMCQHELISIIEEAMHLAGGLVVADLYPSFTWLQMFSVVKAKSKKMFRKIDEILDNIIKDHKNRRSSSHLCEANQKDLVDVLLGFQQPNKDICLEHPVADDNVKAVILVLSSMVVFPSITDVISAGSETSSAVVEWAMSEMVKNPKVMEKAQAEVRKVYNSKGHVDETDLDQLTYLKCVIKETMRLHPPTPLLLPRESKERCEINGYDIPAGTRVLINALAIGRDPKHWTNAETFKPERFLDSSIDYKGTNYEFIPFGAGRRMCPGIAFAIADIELPLAQLVYHFDWRMPNGIKNEELDMSESYGFTARRQNGLCMIPIVHHHQLSFIKHVAYPNYKAKLKDNKFRGLSPQRSCSKLHHTTHRTHLVEDFLAQMHFWSIDPMCV
ncbi:Cytochrome P450 71D10, partial [Mucuna pruriens]